MEKEMFTMPAIDMVATGRNIARLRGAAGLVVRDLQDIFGFVPRTPIEDNAENHPNHGSGRVFLCSLRVS